MIVKDVYGIQKPSTLAMPKVGLIGLGRIGGTLAHLLLMMGGCKIKVLDAHTGAARGRARDLQQAAAIGGYDPRSLEVATEYTDLKDCQIVVVTAGIVRRPNMEREALLQENAAIIQRVGSALKEAGSQAIVVVVTNPVDIMTHWMQCVTHFPAHRVLGMAGVLDTGRFRLFLSQRLSVSISDIQTWIIGAHDMRMLPVLSCTTIRGIPLMEWLSRHEISQDVLQALLLETKQEGATIVKLLEKESAYYGPAQSLCSMVEAILENQRRLFPASVYLQGEYGVWDTYIGTPAIIGAGGVEEVVELPLTRVEQEAFHKTAVELRNQVLILRGKGFVG